MDQPEVKDDSKCPELITGAIESNEPCLERRASFDHQPTTDPILAQAAFSSAVPISKMLRGMNASSLEL
jgi:hypothetical protein